MSNLPIVSAGGSSVTVPGGTGSAVGDLTTDRGTPSATGEVDAATAMRLGDDVSAAIGVRLSAEQFQRARDVFARHQAAADARDKAETVKALRARWGADYESRINRIQEWLGTLPDALSGAILDARDAAGRAVANRLELLLALDEEASGGPAPSNDERDKSAAQEALRFEWGGSYEANVETLKHYLDTMPAPLKEGLSEARDSQGVAILNRPAVLRWLLTAHRFQIRNGTDGGTGGGATADVSARCRELKRWLDSGDPRYWKDEAAQREYRQLLEGGINPGIPRSTSPDQVDPRIAEIEGMMANRSSAYWRGPQAEALQREYRELLNQRRPGR